MQAYRYETVIEQDGKLALNALPLKAGANVEVIILVHSIEQQQATRYPLHNVPIIYINPTDPVAESDWEVLQ